MKKILTCEQMRMADAYTIRERGVPSLTLMERAGEKIAEIAKRTLARLQSGRVLVVCGSGNNGGDGYCAARILAEQGVDVSVFAVFAPGSEDCIAMRRRFTGAVYENTDFEKDFALVIDCIYGTGFHGAAEGAAEDAIKWMNGSGAFVLSADIPSGLNGDNGTCAGAAVRADMTAAIGELKAGLLLNDGRDLCGKIEVCDIGIQASRKGYAFMYEEAELASLFAKRRSNSHKGNYGRVCAIGGSEEYSGAPLLSVSALKAGAGYFRLCVPDCIFAGLMGKFPEIILHKMPSKGGSLVFDRDSLEYVARQSDSIAVGMGCTKSRNIYEIVRYLLENFSGTLVLDADALNSLSEYGVDALKNKACRVVLTPHVKEFARLIGKTTEEVVKNGMTLAERFAAEYGVTLALKSNTTIVTDGTITALNTAGSPALAKGGSGDMLAGLVAALCARTDDHILACACALWILGESGVAAAEILGEYGTCASDVLAQIPKTAKRLEKLAANLI